MRYLGAKTSIAAALTPYIRAALRRAKASLVLEPFCGGLGMTCALVRDIPLVKIEASDVAPGLMTLYKQIQVGWRPPKVSPALYAQLKLRKGEDDPLVAFAGFGCAFGASYFSGYARDFRGQVGTSQAAVGAARSVVEKVKTCRKVKFIHRPYTAAVTDLPHVLYCDPPYANTSGYSAVGDFDSAAFWTWCRERAAQGVHVLVSEYTAPLDIRVVWSRRVQVRISSTAPQERVENLYYLEPRK